jgi:Leucine-rich repeat (LRR) protein
MKKLLLLPILFIISCSTEPEDCAGVASGSASIDECGLCTGGTTELEANYLKDNCGVCGGDNSTCIDCANVTGGSASIDECGVCTGGTTGLLADYLKDSCGICEGDGTTCLESIDFESGNINVGNYYNAVNTTDIGESINYSWSLFFSDSTSLSDSVKISVYKGFALVYEPTNWYLPDWTTEDHTQGSINLLIENWGTGDNFRIKITDNYGNFGYSQQLRIGNFNSATDLQVLSDIILLNNLYPSNGPFYEPEEIGSQSWSDGRLIELDLSNFSLDTLPASIGNLSMLQELELKFSSANSGWESEPDTSYLPEEFGNLTSLQELTITNSNLYYLPQSFSSLVYLQELDLSRNNFVEFPEQVLNLNYLQTLDLSYNDINSIPENIGDLTSLRYLYLNSNQITGGIPESIVNIYNLYTLNLDHNELTEMSENICDIEINNFYFDNNNLCVSSAPACMLSAFSSEYRQYCEDENSDQQFLRDIIEQNNLNYSDIFSIGSQEWSFGRLSSLILYNDWHNYDLTIIPESISLCSALTFLNIANNNLESLPEEICDLPINWTNSNATFNNDGDYGSSLYAHCNFLCDNLPSCINGTATAYQGTSVEYEFSIIGYQFNPDGTVCNSNIHYNFNPNSYCE